MALALVGCGGAPSPDPSFGGAGPTTAGGPLLGGQEATTICIPIEPEGTLTIGYDILRNNGEQAITVTDVELIESDGIRVIEASLVALTGTNSVGLREHYPPTAEELASDGLLGDWAARQPVEHAVLPPSDDGQPEAYNLVLAVQADKGRSSSSGIDIRYLSGGEERSLHVPTAFELRTAPESCDMSEEATGSPS